MPPDPRGQQKHGPFDRHRSFGYQVNYLARLLAQSLRARIEPFGVAPGQFPQLLALYETDGLTQAELCGRVRIDQSTMAHTLKRMERDGLVSRARDEEDGRQLNVHLTPLARELEGSLIEAANDVNAVALKGLDGETSERLLATLADVIANLEADTARGEQEPVNSWEEP